MSHGVMVAQQILVLSVKVRVLVGQHSNKSSAIYSLQGFCFLAYGIAAEKIKECRVLQEKYADIIGQCVTENIFERHIRRIFK